MKTRLSLLLLTCLLLAAPAIRAQRAVQRWLVCDLMTFDVTTGQRTTLRSFRGTHIEAPNWSPDGRWLVYNSGGLLWKIPAAGNGEPQQIDTGFATRCNNDHLISADGTQLAVSDGSQGDRKSRIYTLPFTGGTPQPVTPNAPSYLHGWSPDGKMLAYCADRNGNYDVYVIPADGGEEIRLTTAEGLDDGPEYSPCGQYIWFNSVRSGRMQVWRMKADGSEQTQMTFDESRNAWFPHVSPDGKQAVYIAYDAREVAPGDHPAEKHVELWMMPAEGGEPVLLEKLFGGQGTINVHSWAPDSRRIAFVSYRYGY